MQASRGLCSLLAALALGSTACVEAGIYEKAASDLEVARRAAVQKDTEIRALQWERAMLGQQLAEASLRHDTSERELNAQVQQLVATNAGLAERLKKLESDHAALLLTASAESQSTPAAASSKSAREPRSDDLRRRMALAEAQSAAILEELARIERLLVQSSQRSTIRPAADEAGARRGSACDDGGSARRHAELCPQAPAAGDVLDPWGGSRR